MKIRNIVNYLESIAPPSYQESYDNAGLIVGSHDQEVTGVLLCLDSTEAVIEEAIRKNCNLVIAHHPIVFKGLKRFNGANYVERVVIKAIKNDIAIYAAHTNLDNVSHGVNAKICERLKLENTRILAPKQKLKKLYAQVDLKHVATIRKALLAIDSDSIGVVEGSVYTSVGASAANGEALPSVRMEVNYHQAAERNVLQTLRKANGNRETVVDIIPIEAIHPRIGSGMIGNLPEAMPPLTFLKFVKKAMKTSCVKYTPLAGRKVNRVAVCGGAGGFLLKSAIRAGADVFITSDYKYHEFFDADGKIIIADIGHYESEQFTIQLLNEFITKKFSTFAVHLTTVNTNPIKYI